MLKISMTFPERESELVLAKRMLGVDSPEHALERGEAKPVLNEGELTGAREALADVAVRDELLGYLVDLVRRTRTHESLLVGGGPRATQALLAASRAHAALQMRDFVTPDDVKAMARPVLDHRLIVRPEYEVEGLTAGEVVQKIMESQAVPV
jgi:MoxR-like ATPase